MHKRLLIGLAAAGIVGGGTWGFAATLGNITSDNLGADDSVVASCDSNGIAVDYTASYDIVTDVYEVSSVTLEGVAGACDGQRVQITLSSDDTTNSSLGETAVEVDVDPTAGGNQTIPVAQTNVLAEAVTGIHVVISPA